MQRDPEPSTARRRLALVIGSGALKCAAAFGVAKVLQREGVPIDMVSTGPDRDHTILLRHPYQA